MRRRPRPVEVPDSSESDALVLMPKCIVFSNELKPSDPATLSIWNISQTICSEKFILNAIYSRTEQSMNVESMYYLSNGLFSVDSRETETRSTKQLNGNAWVVHRHPIIYLIINSSTTLYFYNWPEQTGWRQGNFIQFELRYESVQQPMERSLHKSTHCRMHITQRYETNCNCDCSKFNLSILRTPHTKRKVFYFLNFFFDNFCSVFPFVPIIY